MVLPWEQYNIADWDKARPGSGALDVAYHRAFEAEVDRCNGHSYGDVLRGFTNFSDTHKPYVIPKVHAKGLSESRVCGCSLERKW